MTWLQWVGFWCIITITQFWRALEIFIAYDFSYMTHQYNLCLRRSRSYKLHWRTMNKKFRAINNYLTNYDYNSFCLQKLRRELKKKNHASSWAFYLQGAIERLFVDANSDTLPSCPLDQVHMENFISPRWDPGKIKWDPT